MPICMSKKLFGIICPTCGVTRCLTNILSLNLIEAFKYHPSFFILIMYCGLLDIIYIINTIFKKKYCAKLYPSIGLVCVFFAIFIFQYIYRVYMIVTQNGYDFL
ncbi:MAG: DUF2752 domain-containing protein [Clostridia bacterium]|nr:DUF2752 domain-containing protein [Clostridia bacterium]